MKPAITLLFIVFALLLTGCGPTNEEVINQFKPQFATLRETLGAIANALPDSVEDQPAAQPLDPAPNYNGGAQLGNTDILMYDQLLNPEIDLEQGTTLDLNLSNYLLTHLLWTGPENPMGSGALSESAGDEFAKEFEQILQMKYLGVARVVVYDPPVAIDAETFEGGYAEVQGFLVDMATREVRCSFNLSAIPADTVSYTYKEGEDPQAALNNFAHSTLWENARNTFIEKMGQTCGGSFALE
jgi:hypothetical protein